MSLEIFVALLVFAFVTSITPGPNNLMLLTSGVTFGFMRTIPHMLGIGFGFTLLLLAVGAGLGALIHAVPALYLLIKVAGGLYLLYLAWHIATAVAPEAEAGKTARPLGFLGAAAFQWINPKAWVMAITAMATYTEPSAYWPTMLLVATAFALVNLPCVSSWAGLGTLLRGWLAEPERLRLFNIGMAVLLVASLWPMLR